MTFVSKNADNPKFKIDMSEGKYRSRRDGLLNILFHSAELPNDLYKEMNLSYDYYRKLISALLQSGLIRRVSEDNLAGYQLSLKGKKLAYTEINYLKYRPCVEEEFDRHNSAKRRRRKRHFAYLYALFDHAGVPFEVFAKPLIQDVEVNDDRRYFYSALEFKRMIGIEATPFKGSKLLGFLIGCGKVVSVFRSNFLMPVFGSHETLIPQYVNRYFSVPLYTAILICDFESSVTYLLQQIVEGVSYDKNRVNTAEYKKFIILPGDDSFPGRLNDLYMDNEIQQRLIERYRVDTSGKKADGKLRFVFGTGFIDDAPVLLCPGNVNAARLKYFVRNTGSNGIMSYIFCKHRDLAMLQELTKDKLIKVITID